MSSANGGERNAPAACDNSAFSKKEAAVVNDDTAAAAVNPDAVYGNERRRVAACGDSGFAATPSAWIEWPRATTIPAWDDSAFAREARRRVMFYRETDCGGGGGATTPPPLLRAWPVASDDDRLAGSGSKKERVGAGVDPERNATASGPERDRHDDSAAAAAAEYEHRFARLGEPGSMDHTGPGDAHRCTECDLRISTWKPGDTFLNQHAYCTRGGCAYLKATYAAELLKTEIGRERFRRGFVAHPNAIAAPAPDAWKLSTATPLTDGIYVTLDAGRWCYMCGRSPGNHSSLCHRRMKELTAALEHTARRLAFD